VWAQVVRGEPPDVTVGLRPPVYVPESLPALKALEAFKASGTHAALVLDEYGGTEGLVTLIDVLEAIVGDLPTPDQAGAGTIVPRADGSWLVDGLTPVDEVTDLLGIDLEAEAEREGYQTMGGFVMAHLGRIPSTGDTFEWHGLRLEVVDMDGQRVDKILIAPLPTRDGPP
jgi:putative hemolysin